MMVANVGSPPSPGTAPAIRCVRLVKRFGEVTAVDGLHLEVARGECFGLLGPNGAGKTTTIEILEGLLAADEGFAELLGHRWGDGHDADLRQRIGVQLQETRLGERLTVFETLRLFRSFYRRGRPVEEAIALVGLEEKRHARVGKLSGGQRQRLSLACALVGRPEVLFLDEPTTGLDPQARLQVWDVVKAFCAEGGTVLFTTHAMEEAAHLAHRVAIMDHGRIIALDTPARLVASLEAEQIVEFETAREVPAAALERLPGVRGVASSNGTVRLAVTEMGAALPALLAELDRLGAPLAFLRTHQPTLEDVFVRLTGRALRDG